VDVLKIHAGPITKKGDIDYESVVKLADGFNAADLRNVRSATTRNTEHHLALPRVACLPLNAVRRRNVKRATPNPTLPRHAPPARL
jgi:hypothetical protein